MDEPTQRARSDRDLRGSNSSSIELKQRYTIVIVTHNMQQAARVSDRTAFLTAEVDEAGNRFGVLVEYDETEKIFTNPSDPRTEAYVTGRFG
ncbi:MAG: hypothetical protein KatS3mg014_0090 [Actinomycetota bacterium]|nr:MAG: hypothetical protein KatS3mg014_0090 [Actinomycetota bacterium]